MGNNLHYATAVTPTPGDAWRRLSDDERVALIGNAVADRMAPLSRMLIIAEAKPDGQVIVSLIEPVSADRRGTLLLDLEDMLKQVLDPGLVIWLEPLGDRNSLRNLRGIEVKA